MAFSQDKIPQERFTGLAEKYVKYRPSYPASVLNTLKDKFGFSSECLVADIGSGTGIFTRLLLENGNSVYAVEPNNNMIQASKEFLKDYKSCTFIERSAEDTGLPDSSVDLVTVAQAFHWFKADRVVKEFERILKSDGVVLLVWNNRKMEPTPFTKELDTLLKKYCTEYEKLVYTEVDSKLILDRFKGWQSENFSFNNYQDVTFDGLKGRLDSSSFCPPKDGESYPPLIDELKQLFKSFEQNGIVRMDYDCNMYCFYKSR